MEDPFFREWVLRPDFETDQFWSHWISVNPDKAVVLDEAKNLLLELRIPEYSLNQEEIEGIWERIQTQIRPKNRVLISRNDRWVLWKRLAAAGVAAALVLGIWWGWNEADQVELTTAYGETLPFTLPDGSKLILNANSTVRFSEKWEEGDRREIWLEGEAFFEVVHLQSHQPFSVYTGNGVEVEVLGTSFSVYDRNKKSQIVLEEGNVSLSLSNTNQPRQKILMKPGDLVAIQEDKVEKKIVNAENYTSWIQNLLILDQTSLQEIIRVGRENFGLEIEIDPEVSLVQTASGSMPLEDPDEFMNLTAKIFNVSIDKKESKYHIKP
jgi:ferric-dicitrate binding protein FerR (iron transport regulator)